MYLVAIAYGAPEPEAGALASVGQRVGATVVVAVEVHPEYERYTLEGEGKGLYEVTTGDGGLCDHHGLTLFPRPELLGLVANGRGPEAAAGALCARLADHPPRFRDRIGEGPSEPVTAPSGSPTRLDVGGRYLWSALHLALAAFAACIGMYAVAWLRAVGLRVALTSGWALRCLALGVGAFVARCLLSPRGITNGNLAGYEKLVLARGTIANSPYGAGWGAVMGLVPGWPDGVFWANTVYASVSVVLLACVTRRLIPGAIGERAGLAAGLFLLFLPSHVGVSSSETMHVSVLAFELAAVWAALEYSRRPTPSAALAAALGCGLAVNIRPDAALAVPVVLLAAVILRRETDTSLMYQRVSVAVSVLASLAVLGALLLQVFPGGIPGAASDILTLPDRTVFLPRFGFPRADLCFQLFLHAGFTPPVLWGLALFGLAALRRAPRAAGLLAGWALLTTLPLSGKVYPLVDALRLQLSGQAPWVALAAVGVAALPRWALPLAMLSFLPYFPVTPWVQTQEWTFLRAIVPTLPAVEVYYAPGHQREGVFAAVMEALGPARWSGSEPVPSAGALTYVGLECRLREACALDGGAPLAPGVRLDGRVDLDAQLTDDRIGFVGVE